MRRAFAAAAILFALTYPTLAEGPGSSESVYVNGRGYVERLSFRLGPFRVTETAKRTTQRVSATGKRKPLRKLARKTVKAKVARKPAAVVDPELAALDMRGDGGRLVRGVAAAGRWLKGKALEIASLFASEAQAKGIDPATVNAIVYLESGFREGLRPVRDGRVLSSAYGLCQLLKADRKRFGLGDRPGIEAQVAACVQKTVENVRGLRRFLGREPNANEVYVAHYQGLGAAQKILTAGGGEKMVAVLNRVRPGWGHTVARANPWLAATPTVASFLRSIDTRMDRALALVSA